MDEWNWMDECDPAQCGSGERCELLVTIAHRATTDDDGNDNAVWTVTECRRPATWAFETVVGLHHGYLPALTGVSTGQPGGVHHIHVCDVHRTYAPDINADPEWADNRYLYPLPPFVPTLFHADMWTVIDDGSMDPRNPPPEPGD